MQRPLVLVQHTLLVPLAQVLGAGAVRAPASGGPAPSDAPPAPRSAHSVVAGGTAQGSCPGPSCEGLTVHISPARDPRGRVHARPAPDRTPWTERPQEAGMPPAARPDRLPREDALHLPGAPGEAGQRPCGNRSRGITGCSCRGHPAATPGFPSRTFRTRAGAAP